MVGYETVGGVNAEEERIFVAIRVRPLNDKQRARNDGSDWECFNDNTIVLKNSPTEKSMPPEIYTFDRVFGGNSSTTEVYENGIKEVALSVVRGINACIFAYGQTSSGKTYTMSGVTEYAVKDIYDYIEMHKKSREFVVRFSAVEIYNEVVTDLLSENGSPLRLLDDPEKGTVIEKLTEQILADRSHLEELISTCDAHRKSAETFMNETSSRSHQILRLTVESSTRENVKAEDSGTLAACVNFVDLAGSERASQTLSAGVRLREGSHINRSLLTIGTVIRKLSKSRNGHVPYRDSKITRILQNSLGGNARTAIICTINPARSHVEQSRKTLVFGSCAKQVTNNAQVNILKSDKVLIEQMRKEFEKLKNKMKSLEASSSTTNSSSLIREKELLIEQMDREIKELTRQRDIAHSRMHNLLQSVGQGEPRSVDDYPASNTSIAVNQVGEQNIGANDFGCLFQSGDQDWLLRIDEEPALEALAVEEKKTEELNYREDITKSHLDNISHSAGQEILSVVDAYPVSKSQCAEKMIDDYLGGAVYCKEVRCIKMEDSGRNLEALPSLLYESREVKSPMTLFQKEDAAASHRKEDYEAEDNTADYTYDALKQKVYDLQKTIDQLVTFLPIDQSPTPMDNRIGTPSPISICGREVSEQRLTPSQSPPFRTQMTRRCSQVSEISAFVNEESNIGSDEDTASVLNFVVAKNNRARRRFKEEYNEITVKAKASKSREVSRSQQGSIISQGSSQFYPSGLTSVPERQWRDIIKLWDSCNAPLAHRTHFFLLFKGDPSDTLYMEVELRRLCFLRDSLAVKIMENDQVLTWDSSAKALNSERKMLSKQIHKKYRRKERAGLYEKWGIDLTTKHRSIQLAWQLWTRTRDMDHVKESAELVAKLVGSQNLGQAPKEMLGLTFFPQRKQRKVRKSWKDNMSLLSFSSFI